MSTEDGEKAECQASVEKYRQARFATDGVWGELKKRRGEDGDARLLERVWGDFKQNPTLAGVPDEDLLEQLGEAIPEALNQLEALGSDSREGQDPLNHRGFLGQIQRDFERWTSAEAQSTE